MKVNMCRRVEIGMCLASTNSETKSCKHRKGEKSCDFRDKGRCNSTEANVQVIKEKMQPKRNILSDGTIPLTESEMKEFNELFYSDRHNVKILFRKGCVSLCFKSPFGDYLTHNWATNVSSILWLAKRFNLNEVKK